MIYSKAWTQLELTHAIFQQRGDCCRVGKKKLKIKKDVKKIHKFIILLKPEGTDRKRKLFRNRKLPVVSPKWDTFIRSGFNQIHGGYE